MAQPHQLGFFTSTSFWSGCQLCTMNGPVPMALRWAKFSSLALMSLGSVDLFFSAQALLMMRSSVNWFSSTGLGAFSMMSKFWPSTATTLSIPWV